MADQPSLDPRLTLDHVPSAKTDATVDAAGFYQPEGYTEPHLPASLTDAPVVPGYLITAELARGGMGCVYAARDETLDREVAIKTLLPGANAERFVTEAKITARLPHPGIPPVHALGTLADGTPYLAMKLIRGRTLADLLKERVTPTQDLSRFVQIFEQIAQAVGFAHAQGILHRDLKPANIMVGAFGEVQVMDWGLAKDQRTEASPRHEPGESASTDNVQHTLAGTIMGTPGYMAPEQARGQEVDARADVFALGSILAMILTGKPAIVGSNLHDLITRSASADLADVRERLTTSGADAELITLALHCLAANAEERPADGHAVAAEVSAYRAGVEARLRAVETERAAALVREAEQRKRRRLLVLAGSTITAVLLIGLAVSLWQMTRAIAAEGKAVSESEAKDVALQAEKEARDRAFKALRSMTEDVVERKFAAGTVLTDEDKAFLRGVIAQYDAFAAIGGDDAESRAIRAEGRAGVGIMRYRLGELKEAEQDHNAAVEIWKQLVADFPTRPEFRQDLARSHNNRGLLLNGTGRLKEAEQDHNAAVEIKKELAADFPTRPKFRQDLAQSYNNRGALLKDTGQLKEAEQDYNAALGLYKQLVADYPTHPGFRQDLAQSCHNRGALLKDTGRLKEAEQDYDAALSIYKQLAADFPTYLEFRQELASSYNSRGTLLQDTGRLKEAEQDYNAAVQIQKQLAADFPTRPDFRQDLAQSYHNRGTLLKDTGRLKEAEQDYNAAMQIKKQLAADYPTRPEFRQDLAGSHLNRGILLKDTGRLKEAEQDYNAAMQIKKQLAADYPTRPEFRQDLAGSHNDRGVLLKDTGRLKEAEQDCNIALSLYKQLAADYPTRPELRQDLAGSHNNRGILLKATDRLKEAEQDYNAAVEIRKQLVADFPTRPDFRQTLATSHNNRGNLLRDTGRHKEAEQDYDTALSIYKQLVADYPTRLLFRQELATSHNNRGLLLSDTGRLKEAEQDFNAAMQIKKQLVADFPTRPEFRQDLGMSHNNRGILLRSTGRLKEAEQEYYAALNIRKQLVADFPNHPNLRNDLAGTCVNLALLLQQRGELYSAKMRLLEGQPHHLGALQANPQNPYYCQFYRNHLSALTEVRARLLEKADAVRTAQTRRDLGWDPPDDAYDAACLLSQCIPIVEKHAKLDAAKRKEMAQFYGDETMKLLREAVKRGYTDAAHMKKDSDLDPLRSRKDFQTLLTELEKKK
ncbi:MAG: tetratricopeptide repeat protein [Gemmataceae bacterium]